MIYLASPYNGTPEVMQVRYEATRAVTARLLSIGHMIYSPIVHCHDLALHHELPKHFPFWRTYNLHFLDKADELWVHQLPGWNDSYGVNEEVLHWRLTRREPITYLDEAGNLL